VKLSAISSIPRIAPVYASFVLLVLLAAASAQRVVLAPCEPSPGVRTELKEASVRVASGSDFDTNIAPFLALLQRYPHDLLVHESYQDAVQGHGIEGHLRKLTEEYQVLFLQHPDELMYRYLYARSLLGRNTPSVIQQITEMVADHPEFAPGHRSLAEIYASNAFQDGEKEKTERDRFLALCPGSALQQRPGALPNPSPLVDQAERLLAENGDPDRISAMALQAIRDDEWRFERIRPFDWYRVDYKRQSQRELQAKYWRVWSIQVHCERKASRPEKAAELLALMEQRAASLHPGSEPGYWDALTTLVRLYEEGNQTDSATQKLNSMRRFLAEHPDPRRTAQLEDLCKQVERPGR
jgi:hypothetical protein